jgi:hypothetical protein
MGNRTTARGRQVPDKQTPDRSKEQPKEPVPRPGIPVTGDHDDVGEGGCGCECPHCATGYHCRKRWWGCKH